MLQSLGDLELRLGNLAAARAQYTAALPLYEAEQDPIGKMNTWISLARLERAQGHINEAGQYYEQVFALARAIGFEEHPVIQALQQEYRELFLFKRL